MMNAQMADTLIEANQNSASAKNRTDKAFKVKMRMMHAALHTHVGMFGNQRCMSRPAAVNSEPSATVQVSQYWIAITKPVPAGADELFGIHVEGAGHRHGHGQFAECEHDQIDDERADAVCQDCADGARLLNGVAGTQEQAGADYAA